MSRTKGLQYRCQDGLVGILWLGMIGAAMGGGFLWGLEFGESEGIGCFWWSNEGSGVFGWKECEYLGLRIAVVECISRPHNSADGRPRRCRYYY